MNSDSSHSSTIERICAGRKAGSRAVQTPVHLGFAVSGAAFIAVYAETYLSLIELWAHTGTFQYAFLVFPIAAVLVWMRRPWLARVAARPRPGALWGVAVLGALWLAGAVSGINLAQHTTVVAIWPVLVYLFYGPRVGGVLAFALGYLLFAIPFGDFLVGPLQTVTAHLAVYALELTGQPVFMNGHFINTPATTWHVAQACSGIKFFVATTAFGVLYAHLFYTTLRRRLVFVACAMVVPIIANGLRVYFTILIGEYFGLQYATGTDHLIFGWQFFGTVLILLFVCGWPWHQPPAAGPVPDGGLPEPGARRMRWLVPAALALIMLPAAWYATGLWAASTGAHATPGLPEQLAGRAALPSGGNNAATAPVPGLDVALARRYGDFVHSARVEYLGLQPGSEGADITNIRHSLYDPAIWRVVAGPEVVHTGAHGPGFVKLILHSNRDGRNHILLYGYRIGSRWVTSPLRFKVWLSLARLLGRPAPAGVLFVSETAGSNAKPLAEIATAAAQALQ